MPGMLPKFMGKGIDGMTPTGMVFGLLESCRFSRSARRSLSRYLLSSRPPKLREDCGPRRPPLSVAMRRLMAVNMLVRSPSEM